LRYREIGFRCNDEREGLQFGCDRFADVVASELDFTEIPRPPFRRDGPQHVREVLIAEVRRRLQAAEPHVDFDMTLLGGDFRDATCGRQQRGAGQIDLGIAATAIVDRGRRASNDRDAVDRDRCAVGRLLRRTRCHLRE